MNSRRTRWSLDNQNLDLRDARLCVGHAGQQAGCKRARHSKLQQFALGDVLDACRWRTPFEVRPCFSPLILLWWPYSVDFS